MYICVRLCIHGHVHLGGLVLYAGGAALCLHPDTSPLRHPPHSPLRHTLGSENTDTLSSCLVSLTKS